MMFVIKIKIKTETRKKGDKTDVVTVRQLSDGTKLKNVQKRVKNGVTASGGRSGPICAASFFLTILTFETEIFFFVFKIFVFMLAPRG